MLSSAEVFGSVVAEVAGAEALWTLALSCVEVIEVAVGTEALWTLAPSCVEVIEVAVGTKALWALRQNIEQNCSTAIKKITFIKRDSSATVGMTILSFCKKNFLDIERTFCFIDLIKTFTL